MAPRISEIPTRITGSKLYNLVACPHRVTMDLFGNPTEQDKVNPFVQLLWERGATTKEVISRIGEQYIDLSKYSANKIQLTLEAMDRGESLIYGGRIAVEDLLYSSELFTSLGCVDSHNQPRSPRRRAIIPQPLVGQTGKPARGTAEAATRPER